MSKIGVTEMHGMFSEVMEHPPESIEYYELNRLVNASRIFKSPIKGYMGKFNTSGSDIVESVISPLITEKPWVYSLAVYQEALAFNILGIPTPKSLRQLIIGHLLKKDNCKKIVFWSRAGMATLHTYGNITGGVIFDKSTVVYPAIRRINDELIHYNNDNVNILFSGDFFRKGGVNVIDAFEKAQKLYPNITLRVCCDENIDFNTLNHEMRDKYLSRIQSNKNIIFGRVKREIIINEILPKADIYVLPAYQEAFGFAVLEALAFGIPVIATNITAIPEVITHEESGYLIDVSQYDLDTMFKGYVVDTIPEQFNSDVTEQLTEYLCNLIESKTLRHRMGRVGIEVARTKFSFQERNRAMKEIYSEILDL